MKWFNDGDRNTKFFHTYVIGRRRRLQINEIEDERGEMLKNVRSIGGEAVKVFKSQFLESNVNDEELMLECIPKLITEEQQESMDKMSTED